MASNIEQLSNTGYVGLLVKTEANQFLLLRRRNGIQPYPATWSIPSVTRERLESGTPAAFRAFLKDTTIRLDDKTKMRFAKSIMNDGGLYYIYVYTVKSPFRVWPAPTKYAEHGWFTVDNLPSPITPEVYQAILGESSK